jgi:hypothetical protein
MMTMPQVTPECAEAVLCKALSDDPLQYALDTLVKFHADQPHLANMIAHVADTLVGGEDVTSSDDPEISQFAERQLTMIYALVGLTYGAIKAQVEANELEETFS